MEGAEVPLVQIGGRGQTIEQGYDRLDLSVDRQRQRTSGILQSLIECVFLQAQVPQAVGDGQDENRTQNTHDQNSQQRLYTPRPDVLTALMLSCLQWLPAMFRSLFGRHHDRKREALHA